MATTRCKFKCDSTGESQWSKDSKKQYTAKLSPVYGNGDPAHENTKFWQATPSGSFEVGCTNVQPFEVGKEYYIDISPAE